MGTGAAARKRVKSSIHLISGTGRQAGHLAILPA
jgi:hypothetical protein